MKTLILQRRSVQVAIVVAAAAAAATWLGTAGSGATPTPPGLSSVSNQGGAPVVLSASEPLVKAGAAHGLTVADVRPLGAAGPTTFYRVGSTGCYATGPGLNGEQLAAMFCTGSFPSPSQPVIVNLQRQGKSETDPNPLVTADGLAADAVAVVEFLDSGGNTVESSAVTNNLFRLDAVPASGLASFVALDGSGQIVYTTPAG